MNHSERKKEQIIVHAVLLSSILIMLYVWFIKKSLNTI